MSESAPDDEPDTVDLDDIDLDGYEQLSPAAQQAWLRYAVVALIRRGHRDNARITRGEKQRKSIFIVAACLLIIALVALLVATYSVWSAGNKTAIRNRQFDGTQQQLRIIVCAIPPGTDARFDVLRRQSRCGRYVPISSPTAGASRSRFVPVPRSSSAAAGGLPRPAGAGPTSRSSSIGQAGGDPDVTRSRTAPAPASRTPRAPSSSPSSTSPASTSGLVPGLLCTLLGCSIPPS